MNLICCKVVFIKIILLICHKKSFNRISTTSTLRKYSKQIVQLSVDTDVILDPKKMKFLQSDRLHSGFRYNKKLFCFVKKCKFKNIMVDCDIVMTSPTPLTPMTLISRWQSIVQSLMLVRQVVPNKLKHMYVRTYLQTQLSFI